MIVPALLAAVADAGFAVTLADGGPVLRRIHRGAIMPPDLLEELKDYRADVVAYLEAAAGEACGRCGHLVFIGGDVTAEDVRRLCQFANLCPYSRGTNSSLRRTR